MACNLISVTGGGTGGGTGDSSPGMDALSLGPAVPYLTTDGLRTPGMQEAAGGMFAAGVPAPAGAGGNWWWLVALGIGYVLAREKHTRRRRNRR